MSLMLIDLYSHAHNIAGSLAMPFQADIYFCRFGDFVLCGCWYNDLPGSVGYLGVGWVF